MAKFKNLLNRLKPKRKNSENNGPEARPESKPVSLEYMLDPEWLLARGFTKQAARILKDKEEKENKKLPERLFLKGYLKDSTKVYEGETSRKFYVKFKRQDGEILYIEAPSIMDMCVTGRSISDGKPIYEHVLNDECKKVEIAQSSPSRNSRASYPSFFHYAYNGIPMKSNKRSRLSVTMEYFYWILFTVAIGAIVTRSPLADIITKAWAISTIPWAYFDFQHWLSYTVKALLRGAYLTMLIAFAYTMYYLVQMCLVYVIATILLAGLVKVYAHAK